MCKLTDVELQRRFIYNFGAILEAVLAPLWILHDASGPFQMNLPHVQGVNTAEMNPLPQRESQPAAFFHPHMEEF